MGNIFKLANRVYFSRLFSAEKRAQDVRIGLYRYVTDNFFLDCICSVLSLSLTALVKCDTFLIEQELTGCGSGCAHSVPNKEMLRANVCKYRATGGRGQKLNFAHILSIHTY